MTHNIRRLAPEGAEGYVAAPEGNVVVIEYYRFDEDDNTYLWKHGKWVALPLIERGHVTSSCTFSYLQCDAMTRVGLVVWCCAVASALTYLAVL